MREAEAQLVGASVPVKKAATITLEVIQLRHFDSARKETAHEDGGSVPMKGPSQ